MTAQSRLDAADATLTVGVLALQGGFAEHICLLRRAVEIIGPSCAVRVIEVRSPPELAQCDALVIPGGESTAISFVAAQSGLLEPLRQFVKVDKKPTWGTCAGLILLSEHVNATKKGGQELIGGLDVRVHRNHFGRQIESFETDLDLPFLAGGDDDSSPKPFPGVFIRAPVVEEILPGAAVTVLAKLPRREKVGKTDNIIAVRQGNAFGTSFHPELTTDARIHVWWLRELLRKR
ncbi:pyridoxine [Ophiocordyceps camponoti-floridani]|uniref:glutaminase n=1 Tax=Ophiocordyceps camponoti-floridani TaxID=2030778 RepID=A0A8H4Q8D1_9HYPO|nr:pyridoxine [Ophiocordyceps camponoti-floridani]